MFLAQNLDFHKVGRSDQKTGSDRPGAPISYKHSVWRQKLIHFFLREAGDVDASTAQLRLLK